MVLIVVFCAIQEGSGDDMRAESIHSDRFDYAENVETTSSMSTPSTGDSNLDNPFAGETLGDTVIHLDSVRLFYKF